MVVYISDTVLRTKILSAFKVPIAGASSSTSTFFYTPTGIVKDSPSPNDFMIFLFSSAVTPSVKSGYQRVDSTSSPPIGITRPAAQDRRHSIPISQATLFPKNITVGTYQANSGGGNYSIRYWYIPSDYSASKFLAYLSALALDQTIPALPQHAGKPPILDFTHLNDFSQSVWQY